MAGRLGWRFLSLHADKCDRDLTSIVAAFAPFRPSFDVVRCSVLSRGAGVIELFGTAATYVDKILKGAKPSELSVEQPTKFELVINLKTAKAHGLAVPPMLLARANEVIE
jgi:ABC transporter substrate binding protein